MVNKTKKKNRQEKIVMEVEAIHSVLSHNIQRLCEIFHIFCEDVPSEGEITVLVVQYLFLQYRTEELNVVFFKSYLHCTYVSKQTKQR